MNKRYHSDIKDSNILIDNSGTSLKARLIDWGLSVEYISGSHEKFPKNWRNRPLQFNVPFSVIIFTDVFIKHQPKFLKDTYIDAVFRIRDNNDLRLAYTFIQHTSKPLLVLWYGTEIPNQIFNTEMTLVTGGLHPKHEFNSVFFHTKVSIDEANHVLHNKVKDVNVKGVLSELKASEVSLVWHSMGMSDKNGSLFWFDFSSVKSAIPIINYHHAVDYLRNLADALEFKEG